jgi:hypothetical protein
MMRVVAVQEMAAEVSQMTAGVALWVLTSPNE